VKNLKTSNMKNYIVPVIILGLLGVLLYTNMFQGEASALKHTKSGDFLLASGIVENNAVVVASEVPGTIKEFYIKEGDTVTKGQTKSSKILAVLQGLHP
jgi:multidrug efflux pump subunit AcrA (membrane-fusion protein)